MLDNFYRGAGRLVRHKRFDRDISVRKLAREMNMCRDMVSKIEEAHHLPRMDQTTQTMKLLRHLGVPASGIGDMLFASMTGQEYPYLLMDLQDDAKRRRDIEEAIRRSFTYI